MYHIYNRGNHKRMIFHTEGDYVKFIKAMKMIITSDNAPDIEIHALCLMGNHFHLIVRQNSKDGISRFMQRLCTSYVKYHNRRHSMSGSLFEGAYRATLVSSNAYLWHLFRYIHLNPLDYFSKNWKEEGVENIEAALKYLEEYPWSSYRETFLDGGTFPFLATKLLTTEFSGMFDYQKFLAEWIKFGIPPQSLAL